MTQDVEASSGSELGLPSPKERRWLRESGGLTYEEVAAEVGVTATTVRSWECGRTEPRGRTREAYAGLLDRLAAAGSKAPVRPVAAGPPTHRPRTAGKRSAKPAPHRDRPAPREAAPGDPAPQGAPAETAAGPAPGGPAGGGDGTAAARMPGRPVTDAAAHGDPHRAPGSDAEAPAAATPGTPAGPSTPATPADAGAPATPGAPAGPAAPTPPAPAAPRTTGPASPTEPAPPPGAPTDPRGTTAPAGPRPHPAAPAATGPAPQDPADAQPAPAPGAPTHPGAPAAPAATGPARQDPAPAHTPEEPFPQIGPAPEQDPAPPGPPYGPRPRPPRDAVEAFDALYDHAAAALVRQTYLLTGRRSLALHAVEVAFRQAWGRWPEVATDRDPVGWVRSAAHEYALSPWHRFRRAHRRPDKPPADTADRILLEALLALPPVHRRTVLLYDGVGLDLPDTAAETEASTPATGHRLLRAHAELARRIPLPAGATPERRSAMLRERLGAVRPAVSLEPRPAATVRAVSEHRARRLSRAALVLTAVIAASTGYTTVTAPDHYEPPVAPGASVSGVPPLSGPPRLTETSRYLQDKLRADPAAGPHRLHPRLE
ncbi:helix-turn-helix domain-containing protein [Streptomyces racemochromogenes]|uniref:helix-turn-helix domain-containing protein n=1 Tax=Streptomyces racemochromogenes TaxID=67353 RepID=UPI0031F0C148